MQEKAFPFTGIMLATGIGAGIWILMTASLWPASVVFLAGTLAGALGLRLCQESVRFNQMSEIELLRWERAQLLKRLEQALGCAATRQHGDDRPQI